MTDSFHALTADATPEHRLEVAERTIQLLREEVLRLQSENRILQFKIEHAGGPRHGAPAGVNRARGRAWGRR